MIRQPGQLSGLWSLWRHPNARRNDIVAFQNKRLRRLITHAYENVSYYREMFDRNGLKPHDIRTVADLTAIPVTTKKDLQSLPAAKIVSRGVDPRQLVVYKTTGSAGIPSVIRRTWLEDHFLALLRLRAARYFGFRARDKVAMIFLVPTQSRRHQLVLQMIQALGLFRVLLIDSLLPLKEIGQKLRHFSPDVLVGYPGLLSRCAQILTDDDRLAIRPRFVAPGGEVLTELMRRQIMEGFKAPVFDTYGSHEFNLLAWECRETGELHTCDDGMIVEVLRNGRPAKTGQRGEIVGTNLHSFAMPFIRFGLGDIVTKGSEACRCGQPFSTIRAIQGRMIDFFPLPGGRLMHPYEIVELISDKESSLVRQYRLIQERMDRITLRMVPSSTCSPYKLSLLQKSVEALLGKDVEFRIDPVPEIKLEPSGKFRVSRSMVQSDYDGIDWDHS
jgi:phenylacetate-CoA ligase